MTAKWRGFLSKKSAECPPGLLAKARSDTPPAVAVANAVDTLPLESARAAVEAGVMVPILTGDKALIEQAAADIGWDVSPYRIIDAAGEDEAAKAAFVAAREGDAAAVMKGHLHTDALMKAAIKRETGIRDGGRLVHIFHINPPGIERGLLISDAAVNVLPDMETRKASLRAVAALAQALGTARPKIAILSATEEPIPSIPSAMEARELADWAKDEVPDAVVYGPLALDLILSDQAAALKGLTDNPVAGQADGVIVPDLVSGNALFKALVYLAGGCAAGIVLGGRVPVLLTSRADPPAARLASAAIAAILAKQTSSGG